MSATIKVKDNRNSIPDNNKQIFKRGEIYWAILDGAVGSEQRGERPVVILQNNTGNLFAQTVIVAPVTAQSKKCVSTHTIIKPSKRNALRCTSIVLIEQLRVMDKSRLLNFMGTTSPTEMRKITQNLKTELVL